MNENLSFREKQSRLIMNLIPSKGNRSSKEDIEYAARKREIDNHSIDRQMLAELKEVWE